MKLKYKYTVLLGTAFLAFCSSEVVSDRISSGGCYSVLNAVTDKEYTVGIHAAVDENTVIKVFLYDGNGPERW
ncbi:MAG: hypothetical protein Q4B85_07350 [Lachnospiraceae bacterium]|nr:hypothetical protein [Lachnospiraceae bacterium]